MTIIRPKGKQKIKKQATGLNPDPRFVTVQTDQAWGGYQVPGHFIEIQDITQAVQHLNYSGVMGTTTGFTSVYTPIDTGIRQECKTCGVWAYVFYAPGRGLYTGTHHFNDNEFIAGPGWKTNLTGDICSDRVIPSAEYTGEMESWLAMHELAR